ncbi:Cyclin-dependent kinases regulatory subunit 1 [Hibiscus syriacus]|uniref:Cyclin-dependent kinases regulatory subunit n=1 Tax=Hibiscus syriacus TaxID=106335 RepID=A0A6A3B6N5_HIBSY|nr:Cyclin-dependent kinases regulatory subunit 1 [Hibiscus syriacus]
MGQIQYSEKYFDDTYEYRHVVLPPEVAKLLPKNRLLSENEWRAIGVQQSRGWVHYAVHRPEPHIMLFRRPLNYQQQQENLAQQTMLANSPLWRIPCLGFASYFLDDVISLLIFGRDRFLSGTVPCMLVEDSTCHIGGGECQGTAIGIFHSYRNFKINVGNPFTKENRSVAIGVVARDHISKVVTRHAWSLDASHDPELVEVSIEGDAARHLDLC